MRHETRDTRHEIRDMRYETRDTRHETRVTDTDQGKQDATARSGKAKQIQLAASGGCAISLKVATTEDLEKKYKKL